MPGSTQIKMARMTWRYGAPLTTLCRTTTPAGSALHKQASTTRRPQGRMQRVLWIILPGATGSNFRGVIVTVFAGRRPSQHESLHFGTGPPLLLLPPFPRKHSNAKKIQHGRICFQKSCDSTSLIPPDCAIPMFTIPGYDKLNSFWLSYLIIVTL